MVITTPQTSTGQQPGFSPNIGGVKSNHSDWIDTFVNYWSSKWAHGDFSVPDGWVSAQFGEPDRADYVPGHDVQTVSPRTLLAFTRYAQAYKPGMDAKVDQLMPWTPPGPDDYIEDPVTTASRIAEDHWERNFAANNKTQDIQSKTAAANAFNDAFKNELSKYATQAEIYRAQEAAKSQNFATKGSMWSTGETTRSGNLQHAGSLAMALQQAYDARTGNAIKLTADPGNFIERESAVRALGAPGYTNVPGYKNVDALDEVIRKLINYQPGPQPEAPAAGTQPVPTAPNQATFQPPAGLQGVINQLTNPTVTPTAPAALTPGTQLPLAPPQNHVTGAPAAPAAKAPLTDGMGHTWDEAQQSWVNDSNKALNDGKGHSWDEAAQGWVNDNDNTPYKAMAEGGVISDRQFIAGDPQANGKPNPEFVQIHNPGPNTTASITPLQNAVRAYAYGAPNVDLRSYPDSAYQNYPTLKYFSGRMPDSDYNTLNTGNATGAFGAQLPESGAINYGRYLNVQKDPLSLALLTSSYRSGSRDLLSEVARAKARAPFGQAVQTSLIRT